MAIQAKLDGSFTASPPVASDSAFPAGTVSTPLSLSPSPKTFTAHSGLRVVQGTGAPQALALGVVSATFLYLRTVSGGTVRFNGGAENIPISGTFIMEFPDGTPLTALSITATGDIEYYAGGRN